MGGEGEGFDGLPSLGAGFPREDGLPRSPTRHNGVLSLQDGLFAHLDLGCNSSCLVQGCLFPGRSVGLGSCFSCSGRRASVVVVCFSPYGVLVLDRLLLVCGALSGSVLAFKRPMLLFLWYGVF